MLKRWGNKRAQTIINEYVLVFFLAVTAIMLMGVYFKRAVQARVRDARWYIVNEVKQRTRGYYRGNLYYFYEPYYLNREALTDYQTTTQTSLEGGGTTGIFKKKFSQQRKVTQISETAPPKDLRLTEPSVR